IKISVLCDRDRAVEAVRAVHAGFGLHEARAGQPAVGFGAKPRQMRVTAPREELERDVVARLRAMEDIVVSEIVLDAAQSRVTLRNLPDEPGVAAAVFAAVAEGGIMVDMIVQNVSRRGHASLSFTVPRDDVDQCLLLVRAVMEDWPEAEVSFDRDIARLTVMGIGLRTHTGVGERMFGALAAAGINIELINTSEIRMSAVVATESGERGLACLTGAFGLA
ncbi:MAG: ACT domain-containing protein, partial [Planctomycetes bacterium]|nr:ACT domain-containing protein [Planctomycetota bacterium]